VGRKALEGVICSSTAEVIGIADDGHPLDLGRRTRTVSPGLRRFVLARDMGCTVEGCSSTYRLEIHHTIPWSQGGATDAEDLVSLCWYHHHVAIHRLGLQPLRLGASRVRLARPS
jgi:5-methylcytosine-specific restriction protein A